MPHNHNLEDSAKLGRKPTWDELVQVGNKVDQKIGKTNKSRKLLNQLGAGKHTRVLPEVKTHRTTYTSTNKAKRKYLNKILHM